MAGVPMPARDEQEERREKERASLHDVMEMATALLPGAAAGAGRREGARLSARPRPDAGDAAVVPPWLRARQPQRAEGVSGRQGRAQGRHRGLRAGRPRRRHPGFLRLVPRPHHVSDPGFGGRIIAFGGRALAPDALAKYMNSPDTELFHKGNVLYNFARARKAMGRDGTVIAVEGYMDVIALAQAGFENAVAPLGTALTENQLELLWRMAAEPMLCFDGDQAGLKAAWRAADLALPAVQAGRTARFALLPEGKDPDDLVRPKGRGRVLEPCLPEARPLADLLWMRETSGGVFDTPERRAELKRRCAN